VHDAVPAPGQFLAELRWRAVFEFQIQPAVPFPARRIARRLRLLARQQHPDQGLHVALRLHVAAHHAKAHLGCAVAHQEGRDDRVKWPLARCHAVRMVRVQAETVSAVLQ